MPHLPLWDARNVGLAHLAEQAPAQVAAFEDVLALIDRCIDVFEAAAQEDTYARVCGLTLLKAKNLGIGAYSLILDGLGQEAGALLRPFIEYTELLTYFRLLPDRVELALNNELPNAGARARQIEGMYQEFRAHLNEHAAHSSYSAYSLSHLLERDTLRFKKMQRMVPHVLERNVRDLAIQLSLLLQEAVLGLQGVPNAPVRDLAVAADELKGRLLNAFGL